MALAPKQLFELAKQRQRETLASGLPGLVAESAPRSSLPALRSPLSALTAYVPFAFDGDLGAEYNRIMQRLDPGEWALFIDHDAMMLTNSVWDDLLRAIAAKPDAGAFVCWTNRTGNPRQKAKAPEGDDIRIHEEYARELRNRTGGRLTDVTGNELTGVWFATSREAWERAGGFIAGFGEVDNGYARALQRCGLRIWRLDGAYVYHQRRTNGWKHDPKPIRPEIGCRKTSWLWAQAAPILAESATGTIAELFAAHTRTIETRRDWSECQKNARRKSLLGQWRQTMRVSLCIPAREEPPEELAYTIASFRAAGVHQILVADDGSRDHPVREDCGADIILRHAEAAGVAPSRNELLAAATGDVIAFSDSHCNVAPDSDLPAWAFQAMATADMLCSVCGSYENPDTWYWGCELRWKTWRYDVNAYRAKTLSPDAVFGSVYCASRATWDRLGGWVPTRGWGYNEQALSLACRHCGVRIRIEPDFRTRHKFRNDRKFPFALSGLDSVSNVPWTHWLLSTDDEWARIAPVIQRGNPQAYARALGWIAEPGSEAIRDAYRARMAPGRRDPLLCPIAPASPAPVAASATASAGGADPGDAAPALSPVVSDGHSRGVRGDASPRPPEASSSSSPFSSQLSPEVTP